MSTQPNIGQSHQSDPHGARLVLLVPKAHVKVVKSALERHKKFDRHHGISAETKEETEQDELGKEQRMRISTTIPYTVDEDTLDNSVDEHEKLRLLTELGVDHLQQDITLSRWKPSETKKPIAVEHNPLRKALREALEALPSGTLASLHQSNLTVDLLVSSFPESYSIYAPLLLLPSSSIGPTWNSILSNHIAVFRPVWQHIAAALHCTHIALNSPIPPSNAPSSTHGNDNDNILRSPVNLLPILGDFGPAPTALILRTPTAQDFEATLWVTTTQNGIRQTWAPLYTMFSRGNVKEKARILHLPSISSLSPPANTASAVDLYAGIGYFAFSYKKAKTQRVLCWELNAWSIEGLRRGAALNGWRTRVFTPTCVPSASATLAECDAWAQSIMRDAATSSADFLIFHMSNATAGRILHHLRPFVPPIRHVNLGLLPVSRLSWPAAVGALDAEAGGWVHAHENVGVHELDERRVDVEVEFQRLANTLKGRGEAGGKVRVEHVEKVKMYAPGVVHAVFDVHVPGMGSIK